MANHNHTAPCEAADGSDPSARALAEAQLLAVSRPGAAGGVRGSGRPTAMLDGAAAAALPQQQPPDAAAAAAATGDGDAAPPTSLEALLNENLDLRASLAQARVQLEETSKAMMEHLAARQDLEKAMVEMQSQFAALKGQNHQLKRRVSHLTTGHMPADMADEAAAAVRAQQVGCGTAVGGQAGGPVCSKILQVLVVVAVEHACNDAVQLHFSWGGGGGHVHALTWMSLRRVWAGGVCRRCESVSACARVPGTPAARVEAGAGPTAAAAQPPRPRFTLSSLHSPRGHCLAGLAPPRCGVVRQMESTDKTGRVLLVLRDSNPHSQLPVLWRGADYKGWEGVRLEDGAVTGL